MKLLRNVMLLVSIAVLVLYVFFAEGYDNVAKAFGMLRFEYVGAALFVCVASFSIDALIMHILRRKYQKVGYLKSLYNVFFVFASNNLIPPALQVGLAVETSMLSDQGMKVSDAGSLILYRQAICFLAVAAFPLSFMLITWGYFSVHASSLLLILFAVGLVINILTSAFYAFVGTWSGFLKAVVRFLVKAGNALRVVRNPERVLESADSSIMSLKDNMRNLPFHLADGMVSFILGFVRMFALYMSSYFIAKSLGIPIRSDFAVLIAACSFVYVVQSVLPVPGGLGIADYAYVRILSDLVGDKINIMMLLWRIITFYFPAIVSIILMSVPYRNRKPNVGSDGCSNLPLE